MSRSRYSANGHLFIINGDLRTLKCDAVLVPTDTKVSITNNFRKLVADPSLDRVVEQLKVSTWGTRTLVRVGSVGSGPIVWLGNIGGTSGTKPGHFVAGAEQFVKDSVKELRAQRRNGPLPTVALPVVGSGRGGGASRRGAILNELVPKLVELAERERCDIVLVAFGRPTYDAAQTVRRTLTNAHVGAPAGGGLWCDLDTRRREAADAVAAHARRGDLVVFVGAGVSASAGLPAWKGLLKGVAAGLGFDDQEIRELQELDVRDQATLLSRRGKRFQTAVRKALSSGHYSLNHGLLVSLPVREFVTTNFDTLLETASDTPGNTLTVVPGGEVRSSSRMLVKLHGTLGKDLVLTRSEYRDVKSRHGALFGLLQAYMITKHMLFVGYSMQDEDFNDVMHDVRELRKASTLGVEEHSVGAAAEPTFGTVLTDFGNSQFAALWGDLEVLPALPSRHAAGEPTGSPTPEDWHRVAREQALFLDRVGMMSASAGFATDPSFVDIKVRGADQLRQAVTSLRVLYNQHGADDEDVWRDVRLFLDAFSFGDG